MIEFTLPYHCRARVWLGELPQASYLADYTVERSIEAKSPDFNNVRLAAVELREPKGPRVLYGLLGAEFRPLKSNNLDLQVNVSSNDNLRIADSSLNQSGDILVGLPKEYIDSVVRGVFDIGEKADGIFAGTLLFNCAAHSIVGSSESIFRRLSYIVVQILFSPKNTLSEHDLSKIFIPE